MRALASSASAKASSTASKSIFARQTDGIGHGAKLLKRRGGTPIVCSRKAPYGSGRDSATRSQSSLYAARFIVGD